MTERRSSTQAGLCNSALAIAWWVYDRLPMLVTASLLFPTLARAQVVTGGTDPTTILNNIASFILGPFGEGLAVLAIIGIGFAFILGRASLGIVGSIVGGLVMIFGASYLVTQFVGAG